MESNSNTHTQAWQCSNAALKEFSTRIDDLSPLCESNSNIFHELISQILQEGRNVRFRAPGKSMRPAILDGDVLIVAPIKPHAIKRGDIILYQADNHIIVHRVIDIESARSYISQPRCSSDHGSDNREGRKRSTHTHYSYILRGDASYSYDEPVHADQVLGKIIIVERNSQSINPYSFKHKFCCWARKWSTRLIQFIFSSLSVYIMTGR